MILPEEIKSKKEEILTLLKDSLQNNIDRFSTELEKHTKISKEEYIKERDRKNQGMSRSDMFYDDTSYENMTPILQRRLSVLNKIMESYNKILSYPIGCKGIYELEKDKINYDIEKRKKVDKTTDYIYYDKELNKLGYFKTSVPIINGSSYRFYFTLGDGSNDTEISVSKDIINSKEAEVVNYDNLFYVVENKPNEVVELSSLKPGGSVGSVGSVGGGNYKSKYLKYKNKYLQLKNKNN